MAKAQRKPKSVEAAETQESGIDSKRTANVPCSSCRFGSSEACREGENPGHRIRSASEGMERPAGIHSRRAVGARRNPLRARADGI